MIRPVNPAADATAICEIYNYYITDTAITFETVPLTPNTMRKRIEELTAHFPYLVCEQDGKIVGYCYAGMWRNRAAYDRTVETTVYLDKHWTGKGIGCQLYQELLRQLKTADFHVAVAGITLPNIPSVALHEKSGYRKVAHFTEVGNKFGKWLDVGFWEFNF